MSDITTETHHVMVDERTGAIIKDNNTAKTIYTERGVETTTTPKSSTPAVCEITPIQAYMSTNLNSKIKTYEDVATRILNMLGFPSVGIKHGSPSRINAYLLTKVIKYLCYRTVFINQLWQQQQKTTIMARMMIQVQLSSKRLQRQLLFIICSSEVCLRFCTAHLHIMYNSLFVTLHGKQKNKRNGQGGLLRLSYRSFFYFNSALRSLFIVLKAHFPRRQRAGASRGR